MTDELDAELAAWAESDAPVTVPGRILRGAAARAAGRRALAWAGYPNVEAGRTTRAGTGPVSYTHLTLPTTPYV